MQSAVVALLFLVGVAVATQVYNGQVYPANSILPKVPIVDLYRTDDAWNQFVLSFTSADGTQVKEEGHLEQTPDKSGYVLVRSGTYSYYDPSGKLIVTDWVADKNGFTATGDHLPQA